MILYPIGMSTLVHPVKNPVEAGVVDAVSSSLSSHDLNNVSNFVAYHVRNQVDKRQLTIEIPALQHFCGAQPCQYPFRVLMVRHQLLSKRQPDCLPFIFKPTIGSSAGTDPSIEHQPRGTCRDPGLNWPPEGLLRCLAHKSRNFPWVTRLEVSRHNNHLVVWFNQ